MASTSISQLLCPGMGGQGSRAAEDGPQVSTGSSTAGFLSPNQPGSILSEIHPISPKGLWGIQPGTKWLIPFSILRDKKEAVSSTEPHLERMKPLTEVKRE